MHVNTNGRFIVAAVASLALASGCSGGSPVSMPQGSVSLANPQSIIRAVTQADAPEVSHDLGVFVYTAQLYGHDLEAYKRHALILKPFRELTNGISAPQGTVTTSSGWWYVANSGHANVLVYRTKQHGPVGPKDTLDDYGQVPVNVDVTTNRRLVAVSNGSTASGGSGSVSVYLDRQAEPSRTLTYGSALLVGAGVAIDHHGNCYWSFNDGNKGGSIVEFDGCNGRGHVIQSSIAMAGGLAFDQRGNLYYVDQTNGVYQCKRTSQCRLFVGVGSGTNQLGVPTNINFDHRSKYLWVADATGYIVAVSSKSGAVVKIPAVGGPSDPPFGIAPAPGS